MNIRSDTILGYSKVLGMPYFTESLNISSYNQGLADGQASDDFTLGFGFHSHANVTVSTSALIIGNPSGKIKFVKADHQISVKTASSVVVNYSKYEGGYYYYPVDTLTQINIYEDSRRYDTNEPWYNTGGPNDVWLNLSGVSFVF